MQKQKAKQEYFNSLNAQIKSEKQRKKYDILMTEHERRVHDKTIKAFEHYEVGDSGSGSGVPKLGQNYSAIQNKYIGRAFGTQDSPINDISKRTNLNQVASVSDYTQIQKTASMPDIATRQGPNGEMKRYPSKLAMAGSMNLLGVPSVESSS